MVRPVSWGGGDRGYDSGRSSFEDTRQRGCCGTRRSRRGSRGERIAPTRQNAQALRALIQQFIDMLKARFGGDQGGGRPMPVEPDGGIGDGAGPIPGTGGPMPVEPDGGIGDGAGPIPGAGDGGPPEATTLAIGEEDGGGFGPFPPDPDGPPEATTLAIGEEDGGGGYPVKPPVGGGEPPEVTTFAIGEEDGGGGFPGKPPEVTTLAIGEEDGGGPIPVEPDGGIGDGAGPIPGTGDPIPVEPDGGIGDGAGPIPGAGGGKPPEATTLALGEEDGGFGPDHLINVQEPGRGKRGGIPSIDIARFGRHRR